MLPCIALLLIQLGASFESDPVVVHAKIGSAVLSRVLPEYLSIDVDFWHNTSHDCGQDQGSRCWGDAGALWLDLQHPLLRSAVSALSPGFLRLGGSLDNVVKYLVGNMTSEECNSPVYAKRQYWYNLCLNMTRWDDILQFAVDSGHRLVLGLSYQTEGESMQWDPSNVNHLLSHTAGSKVMSSVLYGVELGEEMAPQAGSVAFTNLVSAYGLLRKNLAQLWPDPSTTPKVLGPCVGMQNEVPGVGFGFTKAFLNSTVSSGVLDAVVMHSYNNDGGNNWQRPGFLSQTLLQANNMLQESRKHSSNIGLWCGECGPHNAGGLENVTDRFMSSFWYADALGGLAKAGFEQFGRQALVGGNYGMLQMDSFEPNPDFYTAVLWKRLMGPEVLAVDVTVGSSQADALDSLHIYAHCSSVEGGVTMLFINVDENRSFSIVTDAEFENPAGAGERMEYHVTSLSTPFSRTVRLNGKALVVKNATLPLDDLKPRYVDPSKPIDVAPLSYGFVVLPGVKCPSARGNFKAFV